MNVSLRERLPQDVALMLSLVVVYFVVLATLQLGYGVDSHAYWAAWRGEMYEHGPTTRDAYLYSPAFAQAIRPLAMLPWPIFASLVSAMALGTIVWLTRGMHWRWRVPLLLACSHEIVTGNINWLMALVAAYGLRWPALWALPALTKITPAVGFVWFAVRREWRNLSIATGATLGVAAASWFVSPQLWEAWLDLLINNREAAGTAIGGPLLPPPIYRIPFALILVAWGAWGNRPWTIPVAMILAAPVSGPGSIALLAALPYLNRWNSRDISRTGLPTADERADGR